MGVFESFDDSKTWKFVNNLPLTQFYKLAVDDAAPGITSMAVRKTTILKEVPRVPFEPMGYQMQIGMCCLEDGHQPATEPGNPDIVYAQWQQGNLYRIDKTTMESIYIKPQSGTEPYERYNWDAPILVSHT